MEYYVMFSFKEAGEDNWKYGETHVSTDLPIDGKNVETLREVAREIGKTHGYTQVAINMTYPPMENIDYLLDQQETNAFGQVVGVKDAETE